MRPLEEVLVPVETGALEAEEGADDATGLEEAETVAKMPPDEDWVLVGFESEGTE